MDPTVMFLVEKQSLPQLSILLCFVPVPSLTEAQTNSGGRGGIGTHKVSKVPFR